MTAGDTDARQRYEEARQRLVGKLGDRVYALAGVPQDSLMVPEDNNTHRAAVIEAGLDLIVPLRRFVEQELTLHADPALLETKAIDVDDIVVETYLAAVDRAETAPVARAFYTWLRRIARREVRKAILANADSVRLEQSLHTPVSRPAFDSDEGDWPQEVLRLIDILADPQAMLPEEVMQQQEVHDILSNMLTKLPEQWREVFLLKVVDGWQPEEISAAEGIDPDDVDRQTTMSREFLLSWFAQAGIRSDDLNLE